MKLHSPQFQKRLRRGVRKAVRQSRELKREFKGANKIHQRYSSGPLVRFAVAMGLGVIVWTIVEKNGRVASALAVVTLWAFASVFVQAQRLMSCLYGSPDLRALALLPVTEDVVFRWEFQKFVRGSLWSLIDLLAAYGALAAYRGFSWAQWLAVIPIPVLAWLELLAVAALCFIHLPRLPYQLVSSGVPVMAFLLFMAWQQVGAAVLVLVDRLGPTLNLVLPTGWPALLFQLLLTGENWLFLGMLVPIGAVIWTLKNSWRQLRADYQFVEPLLPEAPDLVPAADEGTSTRTARDQREPLHVGPTVIEEIIQSRRFLAPPTWAERGWIEGLLWRWLGPREKVVSEFVFLGGLNMVAAWKKVFRNLGVTCLLALAVGYLTPVGRIWILGFGLFVTICQVLAQALATGGAFTQVSYSGVNIPLFTGYAIGFRELTGLLFKYSAVQFPLILLFASVWSTVLGRVAGVPVGWSVLLGIKASGLLLFSRFIFFTFAFSSCSNDTSQIRFRSGAIFLTVLVSCLAFLLFGGACLFVPQQGIAWQLGGAAALVAYGFFRVYGWFYHANYFDLMKIVQR